MGTKENNSYQKKFSKKVKSKRIKIAFKSKEPNGFMLESFKIIKSLIDCFENIMTGSPGIVWGILLSLSLLALKTQAAPMETDMQTDTSIAEILSSTNSSSPFVIYSIESMEANTYSYALNKISMEIIAGITSACKAIPILHNICL